MPFPKQANNPFDFDDFDQLKNGKNSKRYNYNVGYAHNVIIPPTYPQTYPGNYFLAQQNPQLQEYLRALNNPQNNDFEPNDGIPINPHYWKHMMVQQGMKYPNQAFMFNPKMIENKKAENLKSKTKPLNKEETKQKDLAITIAMKDFTITLDMDDQKGFKNKQGSNKDNGSTVVSSEKEAKEFSPLVIVKDNLEAKPQPINDGYRLVIKKNDEHMKINDGKKKAKPGRKPKICNNCLFIY